MKISKKYILELYQLKKKGSRCNTDLLNNLLYKKRFDLPYFLSAFRKIIIQRKQSERRMEFAGEQHAGEQEYTFQNFSYCRRKQQALILSV